MPGWQESTLLQCLQHWEQQQPDTVYLTQPFPDGRVIDYTWAQVGDQARRMATYLRSLQLPPQSRIALLGRNSAHWIIADLAIMMAGHVSVPLFAMQSAETARHILDHSEAQLLFLGKLDGTADNWPLIEAALPPGLPLIGLPMSPRADIPQWNDVIARNEPLQQVHGARPDELCTIVYTSGSTGMPKGVMHSHGAAMSLGPAASEVFGANAADRLVSYLPLAHIAERAFVEACSLHLGVHVFFCNSVVTFVEDLQRARPTIFLSVPRLWIKFQQAVNEKLPPSRQRLLFAMPLVSRLVKRKILHGLGLDCARLAITGTAPLPPSVLAWYRGLGLEMLEGYGMTEAFITHVTRIGQFRSGFVGTPLPGVQARIDSDGELLVKGPGQMLGYYKLPEETQRTTTPDGYFRTGDCGEIDAQGRLRLIGRAKEQFKTLSGEYVVPNPIEMRLGSHPRLESVCVTGPGLPQPFALLMPSEETQHALLKDAGLRDALTREFTALLGRVNATLAKHEQLACVVVAAQPWTVENGMLTPTLKIRRAAIEAHYLPRAPAWLSSAQKVIWEAS